MAVDIRGVVSGGFCVGCGACAVVAPEIRIRTNDAGYYQADLGGALEASIVAADRVCPFSSASANENVLAEARFSESMQNHDERVGYFNGIHAGHVESEAARMVSSSGGLTTWLLSRLLLEGRIDGVIHVGGSTDTNRDGLFEYTVSSSVEELFSRRKSQYYSTEFSGAMSSIMGNGKRYAFVGVPCYVKAARALAVAVPELASQLVYFIGIVCGHLKSRQFAELMAWQVGVTPSRLKSVDFRHKVPAASASDYEFLAKDAVTGSSYSRRSQSLFGGDWGLALFQLRACDYCDDIFAEAADVCFGDAWLEGYVEDWRGNNIVICRDKEIERLLLEGQSRRELTLSSLTPDSLVRSQEGNFRHRWDGLSVRLLDAKRLGLDVPDKRIQPGSRRTSFMRRRIVRLRQLSAQVSHEAFIVAKRVGTLDAFFDRMMPIANKMSQTYRVMRLGNARHLVSVVRRRLLRLASAFHRDN